MKFDRLEMKLKAPDIKLDNKLNCACVSATRHNSISKHQEDRMRMGGTDVDPKNPLIGAAIPVPQF